MKINKKQIELLDDILEYLGFLQGEKAEELNKRLYNEILKKWEKSNNENN